MFSYPETFEIKSSYRMSNGKKEWLKSEFSISLYLSRALYIFA